MSNILKNIIVENSIDNKDSVNNINHIEISHINSYIHKKPINYNDFLLSKKCKFLYIELCKNEYLFIPYGWYHWIESEPNTIAFSYNLEHNIPKENLSINYNNKLINCIKKKIPFHNKHKEDKFNINYDDFINNLKNNKLGGEVKNDKFLTPFLKPYIESSDFFKTDDFKNLIENKENLNKHFYIGRYRLKDLNIDKDLKNIPNFNNILNDIKIIDTSKNKILFDPGEYGLWLNNNTVLTGLHCDYHDNILYVVSGKKKVLLASPQSRNSLYHVPLKSMVPIPIKNIDQKLK